MSKTDHPKLQLVIQTLEDIKANHLVTLDVAKLTSIADHMVIASGTSSRHLKAMANDVIEKVKAAGELPLGVEGMDSGDWVLVDLGDILVHLMLNEVREHYDLESLWSVKPAKHSKSE